MLAAIRQHSANQSVAAHMRTGWSLDGLVGRVTASAFGSLGRMVAAYRGRPRSDGRLGDSMEPAFTAMGAQRHDRAFLDLQGRVPDRERLGVSDFRYRWNSERSANIITFKLFSLSRH